MRGEGSSPRICLDRTTTRRLPLQKSWPLVPKHPRPLPAGGDAKVASISGADFLGLWKGNPGKKWHPFGFVKSGTLWSFSIFSSLVVFFPKEKQSTKFEVILDRRRREIHPSASSALMDMLIGLKAVSSWSDGEFSCSVSNNFRTFWLKIANVWIFAWKNMWIIHCALTKLPGSNV